MPFWNSPRASSHQTPKIVGAKACFLHLDVQWFDVSSGHLYYAREIKFDDEWLIENHDTNYDVQGTR